MAIQRGLNKVMIIGRLGQDPEIRYMANGDPVANLSVATSLVYNNKETGEKNEITEWHKIVAFGKLADVCGTYLVKGSQAYFEGSLKTRKWQDKNGIDRYTTEIVANDMKMLGTKGDDKSGHQQDNRQDRRAEPVHDQQNDFDDDIPF